MNKKKAMKWVEALRSGEYKQTREALEDRKGYCCLGVACKLFMSEDELKYEEKVDDPSGDEYLMGGMPDDQPNAPKWLAEMPVKFERKMGISLPRLNDGARKGEIDSFRFGRLNFNEIADLIQLVYIEGAFD